jgi:hypothetical protein
MYELLSKDRKLCSAKCQSSINRIERCSFQVSLESNLMFPEVVQAHKDRLIAMAQDQSPSGFLLSIFRSHPFREGRKTDVFRILRTNQHPGMIRTASLVVCSPSQKDKSSSALFLLDNICKGQSARRKSRECHFRKNIYIDEYINFNLRLRENFYFLYCFEINCV